MTDYTVSLSDTQIKSLDYVGADPQEWMENAITNRARKATDEIIALLIKHCNANDIAMAVGACSIKILLYCSRTSESFLDIFNYLRFSENSKS